MSEGASGEVQEAKGVAGRAAEARVALAGGGNLPAVMRTQVATVMVIYKGPGNPDCHRELKEVLGMTPSSTLGWTHRV